MVEFWCWCYWVVMPNVVKNYSVDVSYIVVSVFISRLLVIGRFYWGSWRVCRYRSLVVNVP